MPVDLTTERALADVFNRECQSFPASTPWLVVLRSVARAVAYALYPESAEDRNGFLDDANLSGLFTDRESSQWDDRPGSLRNEHPDGDAVYRGPAGAQPADFSSVHPIGPVVDAPSDLH